ncbi:hypothetical protein JDV02_008037 [Purpureocillium takamizusanense]|uniref:Uncharacterized protein n=1 Tax=Purpureocillium takamizusanense TaxID=2060973 RepID=A0A9Q8QPE8_9HYPO|nr:uncharacterized protein JDV02_008037 [Purpureocillium takamizusanense]UNI22117.1 hypothetical protein JDV02_008037 [Purpureocillium takamizusanense]
MKIFASLFALAAVPHALGGPAINTGKVPLPERLLHHFPNGTWAENISVRPNGNLLITLSTPTGSVMQVKEPWTANPVVEEVFNFDQWVDRLIGIGETTRDTYVVVGSRFYSPDAIASPVETTFCAMELDFSKDPNKPKARLIARLPEAYLLQSVAALPWDRTTVLISDQYLLKPRYNQSDWTPSPGQVWRLNTVTGKYSLVMANYPEMTSIGAKGPDVGINGIKIRGNWFYWGNTDNSYVYRLKIDKKGAPVPPGKPQVVTHFDTFWNDFTFGPEDEDILWSAGWNQVVAVSSAGKVVVVDGVGTSNNLTFPGPTATGFGRHHEDRDILYVTGNLYSIPDVPIDGKIGGWIRAINTTGFRF